MNLRLRPLLFFLTLFWLIQGNIYAQNSVKSPSTELRGAWIATVANIDFPSRPGLSTKQIKLEFDSIMDVLKSMNMNTVFVQIRPAGDAFYKSSTVPLSKFLVGRQGAALDDPKFDPLEYMIQSAHARRLEFHAWLNPYRASFDLDTAALDPMHPLRSLPDTRKAEWFFRYGTKWYFNPASPSVRQYLTNIVKDIVLRYDVDGIHFDDYFYPYKEKDLSLEDALNDYDAFASSKQYFTDITDWRRNNINVLIEGISQSIKKYKPHVKFGISPFGVWRNKDKDPERGSDTRAGVTCYDDLYADVLLWMEKGWIDYVSPQIYWSIGYPPADYEILVDWWSRNLCGKQLFVGHAAYKIDNAPNDKNWENKSEICNQIAINRANPNVNGSIFFSVKPLLRNPLGVQDSLMRSLWKYPSMVPPMPLLSRATPATASICRVKGTLHTIQLSWNLCNLLSADEMPFYYALYRFDGEGERMKFDQPGNLLGYTPFYADKMSFEDHTAVAGKKYTYVVVGFNRANVAGNNSDPVFVKKTKKGAKQKRRCWGYLF